MSMKDYGNLDAYKFLSELAPEEEEPSEEELDRAWNDEAPKPQAQPKPDPGIDWKGRIGSALGRLGGVEAQPTRYSAMTDVLKPIPAPQKKRWF